MIDYALKNKNGSTNTDFLVMDATNFGDDRSSWRNKFDKVYTSKQPKNDNYNNDTNQQK